VEGLAIKNIFKISAILVLAISIAGCTQKANTDQIKEVDNSNIEEAQKSIVIPNTKEISWIRGRQQNRKLHYSNN
jgi:hypothetical protein